MRIPTLVSQQKVSISGFSTLILTLLNVKSVLNKYVFPITKTFFKIPSISYNVGEKQFLTYKKKLVDSTILTFEEFLQQISLDPLELLRSQTYKNRC